MNIIILQGNAQVALLNNLLSIKKDFDVNSITEINGKEVSWDKVVLSLSTPQLFSEKRLVILENFDEGVDISKLLQDQDLTIVFKFSKVLAANSKFLKAINTFKPKILNLTEKDEKSIFPFLDGLADKNPRSFGQLNKLLEEFGGQYVLTMIFFMLRRFVNTPRNLPGFVVQKTEKQKKNFPLEKIAAIYKTALETDFKIKSGLMEEKLGLTLLVEKIVKN